MLRASNLRRPSAKRLRSKLRTNRSGYSIETPFKAAVENHVVLLHFVGANIGLPVINAMKRRAALIVWKWQLRVVIDCVVVAFVDCRAMTQQGMGLRRASVVTQRTEQGA